MVRSVLTLVFLASGHVFAQAGFDVASIRVGQRGNTSIQPAPDSLIMRSISLGHCIRWAYDVQEYQIAGPAWMNDVWLDVSAKVDSRATEPELRTMLQSLLADRFKLTVHRQTREMTSFVLTVGKNPHKLTPADAEGSPSLRTGKLRVTGQGATLSQLTEFLSRQLRFPIIDETGLKGRFNYFLDIAPYVTQEMRSAGGPNGEPPPDAPGILATAIRDQLGLKVDARKSPIDTVVVDNIERTPTEN